MAPSSLWLYRILLRGLLPPVGGALWLQALLTGKRRPPVRQRLGHHLPSIEPGGLWLQAVSVGEVELARRMVSELGRRRPELPRLVTSTTVTGLALARRTLDERTAVAPCPLDLPGPIGRILDAARPRMLTLVETELWPELIHQAGRRAIPVAVVNARLSSGSFARYRRVGGLLAPLLDPISRILARAEADAERFAALGVRADRIEVTGNIKYDLEPNPDPLPWVGHLDTLASGRPVVVAGSTMEGEEAFLLEARRLLRNRGVDPFLVVVPRHPERFDGVARLLAESGLEVARRSRLDEPARDSDVLLLDTIGELGRAYALARVAFVGGSLVGTGGHNPLEAAAWRVPVLTGPAVHNFEEIYREMVDAGAARVVRDAGELAAALGEWLSDEASAAAAGRAGRAVVDANRGATGRTVDAMLDLADRRAAG